MMKRTIIADMPYHLTARFVKKLLIGIILVGVLCGCQSGESCHKVINAKCIECHSATTTCTKIGQSEEWWLRTIDAMAILGAEVSKGERKILAECLSTPAEAKDELICK